MLEELITKLIIALEDNTKAHTNGAAKSAASTPASKPTSKVETPPLKVVDELEEGGDDDGLGDDPEPTAPAKKAPAKKTAVTPAAKKAAKETATLDTIRDLIRNERERLKTDVSAEAVAAHKLKTREILERLGATSVSDLAAANIPKAYTAIKEINVEDPEEIEEEDEDL